MLKFLKIFTFVFVTILITNGILKYLYGCTPENVFNLIPVANLNAIYFDGTKNIDQVILNKDCPENTKFNIFLPKNACDGKYEIFFNGKKVILSKSEKLEYDSIDKYTYFHGDYWFILSNDYIFNKSNVLQIKLKCKELLFYQTKEKVILDIPTIENGMSYAVYKNKSAYGASEFEPLDIPLLCNCNENAQNLVGSGIVTDIIQPTQNSVGELKGFVDSGKKKDFSFPMYMSYGSDTNSKSIE